jgi:hypothetical protein
MRIYSDGRYGKRHISYTDCVEPVNVIEIGDWSTGVLEVYSLYFRRLLSGIFGGHITNNIVIIVVYSICERRHPCTWRYSNPQSQNASGRRPTPYTAWPLGSESYAIRIVK